MWMTDRLPALAYATMQYILLCTVPGTGTPVGDCKMAGCEDVEELTG